MTPLYQTCLKAQTFLRTKQWRFCFIGGIAVQRWGEPRFTADGDITLLTGFSHEEQFIKNLLEAFQPRRDDAKQFALEYRVLLVRDSTGVDLDISLGGLPFEERTIERSSDFEFSDNCKLTTCCAEDLIVHKAFANRDKDWGDIDGILRKQRGKIDFDLILNELTPLVEIKEDDAIIPKLQTKFKIIRSKTTILQRNR